ncbi:MAG: thiol-disulfide oxidoreductase DCC family protein [Acidobacteria bacterium]|nr:thiol-disulfide oxidoreductase DCC family protein [Acidobacteriota bacterium]
MKSVILFDGVCNFCNSSVNFIIGRDKADVFRFAPLQSAAGREFVERFGLDEIDSIILVENDRAYTHSTAALRIARTLGGFWRLFYVFIIVPGFVRDLFYKLFARNRYRLFGQKDACMIPTPEVRKKFLS